MRRPNVQLLMPRLLYVLLATFLLASAARADVSFVRDVAPILLTRCTGCHGPKKSEGDYRLHTFENLLRSGESGEATIVAGKPDESELFRRIVEGNESLRMPQQDDRLSDNQTRLIREWIAAGADFDGEDPLASIRSQLPPREHPPSPEVYRVPVPVLALAFSPDGKELAASGYHEVTVWDVETARLIRRIGRLAQRVHAIRWTDDESMVVGGGTPAEYGEVTVVDAVTGEHRRVLGLFDDVVLDVKLNSTGDRVVAGAANSTTRVYELASAKLLWEAGVHSSWVTSVAFSPDDRFVVTTSKDQTAKVHEAETGELFTTYNGHRKQLGKFTGRFAVYHVTIDPASDSLLTVGEGKAIRIWDPVKARDENGTAADMEQRFFKAGHTRFIPHGFTQPTFKMATRKGSVFAAGADGLIKQFDIESTEHIRDYAGHTEWVYSVATAPTSQRLASGSFDGEVRIWDTETGDSLHTFKAAPGHE